MTPILVSIKDETTSGKITNRLDLSFPQQLITVADIIENRVRTEVALHNDNRDAKYNGLVQPGASEQTLNQTPHRPLKTIDADKQVAAAKDGFLKNSFFLLIDTIQAESLDQTFLLHNDSAISFIKLTPLVGG